MIDYIKHSISSGVLSIYNPLLALKGSIKDVVNHDFIDPIVTAFFSDLGGKEKYSFLDTSLIKTEIDFAEDLDFVKKYLYRTVITDIVKHEEQVIFKPRFTVTFDEDITPETSTVLYPYQSVFGDRAPNSLSKFTFPIRYGTMKLGEEPIIYFIRLHLPTLIKFIKLQKHQGQFEHFQSFSPSNTAVDKLYDTAYQSVQREISSTTDPERIQELEHQSAHLKKLIKNPGSFLTGQAGQLRINLSWDTIDDLDLHVIDPSGNEICYNNKQGTSQGKIGSLDVDANAGTGTTIPPPQENIFWETAPSGEYKVFVNLFTKRGSLNSIPFVVRIIGLSFNGRAIPGSISTPKEKLLVATFSISSEGRFLNFQKLS